MATPLRQTRSELMEAVHRGPVLFYDSDCGFCNESVQFVLEHERNPALRFASLSGPLGRELTARHPELDGVTSLLWVERDPTAGEERVFLRSDATLRVAGTLSLPWSLLGLARLVPRGLRDWVYDRIAVNRHRLSSRESCMSDRSAQRHRFLDA